jgi:hypothetical protein
LTWLALVNQAAQQDWKAAAWLLSHRWPEAYARGVQKVAPTTPDGKQSWQPLVMALPAQPPTMAEWQRLVQQLAAAGESPASDPMEGASLQEQV